METGPISGVHGVPGQSLAERLRHGPLSLPAALECFADIALALRDLHASGQQHGRVNAEHILLTPAGAALRPAEGRPGAGDYANDAMALGALIFQLLTNSRPAPGGAPPWAPRVAGPRAQAANIRASALHLAQRPFTDPEQTAANWAKDAAELRLLAMLAKQAHRAGKKLPLVGVVAPAAGKTTIAKREAAAPEVHREGESDERIEPAIPAEFLKDETAPAPSAPPGTGPPLPKHRRCPDCDSGDVHASQPRTRTEKLANLALHIPLYRCHQCYHRWFLLFKFAIPCKVQKVHRRTFRS